MPKTIKQGILSNRAGIADFDTYLNTVKWILKLGLPTMCFW
jgi:hypothetical protein